MGLYLRLSVFRVLKAQIERDGGRRLNPPTEEQQQLEALAARAHATMAQLELMAGSAEEASRQAAAFKDMPKVRSVSGWESGGELELLTPMPMPMPMPLLSP